MKGVDLLNPPAIPLFEKQKYKLPTENTPVLYKEFEAYKELETISGIYYYKFEKIYIYIIFNIIFIF